MKVHFFSDCIFFAGCENMLVNFFNSKSFRKKFELSFCFVNRREYKDEFQKRVSFLPKQYPVNFHLFVDPFQRLYLRQVRLIKFLFFPLRLLGNVFFSFIFLLILYKQFKNVRPDYLHINNGGYPGALTARVAAIAGKLAGIKNIIFIVNNLAVPYGKSLRLLDWPIDLMVSKSVSVFVTGSEFAANRLRDILRLPRKKVINIFNGIAPRPLSESRMQTLCRLNLELKAKPILVGTVALMIPRKGHIYLLEAILSLVRKEKIFEGEVLFLLEGSGPAKHILESFVSSNKLENFVRFIGHEKNVFNFMAILDFFVLPSISDEDFPNVILEAMSFGLPVISTRLAGIPDQIDDHINGLIVSPRDSEQLANAILTLIKNKKKRETMAKSASVKFVNKFMADHAISSYIELYDSLEQCNV